MGTKTPPPSIPGDTCGHCDGTLWPAGSPPKFIEVKIWDLVKCPDCPYLPPNGLWWLEQSETDTCLWEYKDSQIYVIAKMRSDYSLLRALTLPPMPPWGYFYNYREPCASSFENQHIICGSGIGSIGGNGDIYWPGP